MRTRIRIRPRIWLAPPKPLSRLGWVPLSLIFRKHRSPERPGQSAPRSPVVLFNVWSFLSQISHYHMREGRRLFARSTQHLCFFLNRTAAERPARTKDSRRPEASPFSLHSRERRIETQLHYWRLHEWRQSFTTTDYLRKTAKEMTDANRPRAWSADDTVTSAPDRLLATPGLLRARIFAPAFPLSPHQHDVPGTIKRQTLEAVVEDRLTLRLPKADPQAAPVPAVPFTVPAVQQVWRQPQLPSRRSLGETRGLPTATQSTTADSSTHHKIDLLPPASASVVLPAKVEIPTMERIAEDVMKRIERHLRIERERRGM
jgi:hypothetical protein